MLRNTDCARTIHEYIINDIVIEVNSAVFVSAVWLFLFVSLLLKPDRF